MFNQTIKGQKMGKRLFFAFAFLLQQAFIGVA